MIDGGFSDWLIWGACSVSCGYGIQLRTRTCTNPEPLNGGSDCVGEREDRKQCQPVDCKGITYICLSITVNQATAGSKNIPTMYFRLEFAELFESKSFMLPLSWP